MDSLKTSQHPTFNSNAKDYLHEPVTRLHHSMQANVGNIDVQTEQPKLQEQQRKLPVLQMSIHILLAATHVMPDNLPDRELCSISHPAMTLHLFTCAA